MKHFHLPSTAAVTALVCALVAAFAAPAQAQIKGVKSSGGFFGFMKKGEQLSSGLFPGDEAGGQAEEEKKAGAAEEQALAEATAGQRGEDASADKAKKGGFFSFGRKARKSSDPVVPPIPPAESESNSEAARPAESAPAAEAVSAASPSREPEGGRKRGLGLPFFGRGESRRQDASAPVSSRPPAAEGEPGDVNGATPQSEAAETAAPAASEESGGFFSKLPVPKLRVPKKTRKPTDYVAVEEVVKDGEFVDEQDRSLSEIAPSTPAPADSGAPPRVVDGVKIYSSWDQVEGRSVSASDRILQRLRSHGR